MTGQFQKNVFKIGKNGAEVGDPDAILGKAMNHFGDQVVAAAANRESRISADLPTTLRGLRESVSSALGIIGGKNDGALRAVAIDEVFAECPCR